MDTEDLILDQHSRVRFTFEGQEESPYVPRVQRTLRLKEVEIVPEPQI
jgi:hypothetical protein